MRKLSVITLALLLLTAWTTTRAYAQANGSVGGTVQDTTKALIPGVLVTLKNTETGVVDTRITNDSGSFQFPSVPAGTYILTGELTGFRQAVNPSVAVGTSAQVRVDLTMQIGNKGDAVTVSIADEHLTVHETSSSVGEVLDSERVRTLPLVGGNVLDLLTVLPGFRESAGGAQFDTVGGLGLDTVNTTINGMTTNSSRNSAETYGYQVFTPFVVNPDLVGEIKLILAPVDAELGRGNAQVQIQTRSGTNKYSGSAVWNIQNTALNANTWTNNHTARNFNGKQIANSTPLDWKNIHQITASFGGPIIKNKTFFFFLYDKNMNASRTNVTTQVLTDPARQGIFRYWEGYNPLNTAGLGALTASTAGCSTAGGSTVNTGACSYPSVDYLGNPAAPPFDPGNISLPYTGQLRCFSIYGNVLADGTPFTSANCPGGKAVGAADSGSPHSPWDAYRPAADSTGYINRILALMPAATDFSAVAPVNGVQTAIGDGLNTAAYRYLRGSKKTVNSNTLNAISGSPVGGSSGNTDYANRWQANFKVDHNINQKNRVSVQLSYQSDSSAGILAEWPDGFSGNTARQAYVLTVNGTSTISANLVNEARFGGNYTKQLTAPPWANPLSPELAQAAFDISIVPGGVNATNGKTYPAVYRPQAPGDGYRANSNQDAANTNPLWDFADTVRWTHGKHSFSFGGEYRRPITTGFSSGSQAQPYPNTAGGAIVGGPAVMTPAMANLGNFNNSAELPGLLGTARTNEQNLNYLLYGSVTAASTMNFWANSQADLKSGTWQDTTTTTDKTKTGDPDHGHQERTQISNEWSFFAKDDFKVTKRLTLNLGIRWDLNMSPYYTEGMSNTLKDQAAGLYGVGRPASGDLLQNWFTPGNLYLSGYGDAAHAGANPLSCELGKQQNPNLPVSTCDPNLLATTIFVGPGTDHPDLTTRPQQGRFSPAIGFAYQLPWFGEGQTSIRGGFQRTYGGAGGSTPSAGLGGDSFPVTLSATDTYTAGVINGNGASCNGVVQPQRALNLTDIPCLIPRYPTTGPGQKALPISTQSAAAGSLGPGGLSFYDTDYILPYTDNLTLSLTRNWSRKVSMDIRVVQTLGKSQVGVNDLNQFNTFNNPELIHALDVTRAGGDDPFFDTLLLGLNMGGAAGTAANYGPVGTTKSVTVNGVTSSVLQRGSAQVRRLQAANLANGNYAAVITNVFGTAVNSANCATAVAGAACGAQALPIDPATNAAVSGATQQVLRNGCNRIADGLTTGFTTPDGIVITPKCFPENYLLTNPQFTTAYVSKNYGHSNYTSGQLQFTVRPVQGVTLQGTYSLSKTMQQPGSGFTDPRYHRLDYGLSMNSIGQEFRANGTVELPIGPNKLVMGNTSGWVARAVEKWQTSFTVTLPSGVGRTILGQATTVYANPRPDVVGPWTNPRGEISYSPNPTATNLGTYFPGVQFLTIPDPQCSSSYVAQGLDANGFNLKGSCTLLSLGQVVDAGTPGAVQRPADGKYVLPMLATPLPGHQGNLGSFTMRTVPRPSFNGSASKNFRISESKSLQFRIDATNILNHPWMNDPTGLAGLASYTDNFGVLGGKGANNAPRTFQAQARFSF